MDDRIGVYILEVLSHAVDSIVNQDLNLVRITV